MKKFILCTDEGFRFTSKVANDTSEVFTAFKDNYANGYIIIDSCYRPFILDITKVEQFIDDGIFKIIGE